MNEMITYTSVSKKNKVLCVVCVYNNNKGNTKGKKQLKIAENVYGIILYLYQ